MQADLANLYQDLILDHGTAPRNHGCLEGESVSCAEGLNPLCGDKVKVYLLLKDDKIDQIQFEGKGCAISMASASLMTELFQGKSIQEAQALCQDFNAILVQDAEPRADLGKVLALVGVKAFPARVKCATLAWHAALLAMKQDQVVAGQAVSTE